MSTNELSLSDIKPLCEASDCTQAATKKIQVSAGTFGTIELSLCINCVSKFAEPVNGEKTVQAGSKEIL